MGRQKPRTLLFGSKANLIGVIKLLLALLMAATPCVAESSTAAVAIASLTDPAKLATLISKPNLDYKKYPIKLTRP
jgi:hypothetical protein